MRYPIKKIQTGINNPILRSVSDQIEEIDEELEAFCNTLMIMMRKHDGVGLAAPQIGQNIRIIATSQREERPRKNKLL
jgi:peptide deformylase